MKRFITISIYGYATDHGLMEETDILNVVRESAEDCKKRNDSIKDGSDYLNVTINDMDDLFIMTFYMSKNRIILMV